MIYITVMKHRKARQLTWEDVIADKLVLSEFANETSKYASTITQKLETADEELRKKVNIDGMIRWLKIFNLRHSDLFATNRADLYRSFKIPKNTGGFRQIDAPCDRLQDALRELVRFLHDDCGILYHTSAYAYVENRSIVDCLKRHQKNESNWFLKTDFSGFFPNTTLEFTMKMLSMVFPLSEVCSRKDGYEALEKALSLGFLNGGLPQGTTLSPMLTNCLMIPIDFTLCNKFAHRDIVYTRYADDMHISAKAKFPEKMAVQIIKETLEEFGAPWILKPEKTHYGSRKGKNWCLGLMLNAENNITIGYRQKKYFKAALCSFILDTKNKKYWSMEDVYHLRGQLSYYTMVEPEYFDKIISQQNEKWNVNTLDMFRNYFNGIYLIA